MISNRNLYYSLIKGFGSVVIHKKYFRPKIRLLINFVHALHERHVLYYFTYGSPS